MLLIIFIIIADQRKAIRIIFHPQISLLLGKIQIKRFNKNDNKGNFLYLLFIERCK